MPRHHHHRRHGEPPIPPIPPIPPEPPFPPEGSRSFDWRDVVAMFASGHRGWHRHWGPFRFDVDFDDDGRGRGGGGRRGRSRRMFDSSELQLLFLFLIADKAKEARHGYDLIRSVELASGGEYIPSPGVVYPTLTLLQDMGFIEEADSEGARRAYRATDAGRAHLEENGEQVGELFERLTSLGGGDRESSNAGPAIGRAVKNLMTALKHRVGRDGLNDELLHEIAGILDDAAQRIERIK